MVCLIGKSAWSGRWSLSALALVVALLMLPIFTVDSTRAATTGLVAAYPFSEGSGTAVGDASGTGNSGTTSNTTWSAAGKYGGALSFNGTSARVNIPNSSSLQLTTAMTLEAWVNPATVSSVWRDVLYKGNDNYYLEATSSNGSKPDAGLIAGGSYGDAYGTAALSANTWSFLTETYDGATLRLYVNGTQVAATAHTGAITTSTSQLQIGGDSLYGQYFKGLIDEVRVYNTALSAAAIQTDMNTPIAAGGDTTPPSAPGTLSASVVNAGELDLSWGAATDNVGVTGYRVYRCLGAGCTSYALFASPTGPRRPTRTPPSPQAAATGTRSAPSMQPGTWARSRTRWPRQHPRHRMPSRRLRRAPSPERSLGRPRSTSAGVLRPTTLASPATGCSGAKVPPVPTTPS